MAASGAGIASASGPQALPPRIVRVYFLCIGNSVRSQMAEAFARAHGGPRIEAKSGGTRPAGFVAPRAIEVMRERGIDISRALSKGLDLDFAASADAIVSMGCGVESECPATLLSRAEDWGIPDPVGGAIDAYREARDVIERKVIQLLARLGVTTA